VKSSPCQFFESDHAMALQGFLKKQSLGRSVVKFLGVSLALYDRFLKKDIGTKYDLNVNLVNE
jgi:hypothetical protein